MSTYYVTHPNLGSAAMVHAPTSEKARTTFLDYLERSGGISRADRSKWRNNMIAKMIKDGFEMNVEPELWYGYEVEAPPQEFVGRVGEEQVIEPIKESESLQEEVIQQPSPVRMSPLAQVATSGFIRR